MLVARVISENQTNPLAMLVYTTFTNIQTSSKVVNENLDETYISIVGTGLHKLTKISTERGKKKYEYHVATCTMASR